jgi:acetyl-CoA carboxylase biotin carboxylase subunit
MFKKVLIANRGEIALRILRACKELSIPTVAIHSTADSESMVVRLADESVCIGPPAARDSYLNIPAILAAAEITQADAIHPGFGFLSENAYFASMVADHAMTFIGPSPGHMILMGDKVKARETAQKLGLEVIRGSDGELASLEEAQALAKAIGYPVLIKATAGGGGKGMRVIHHEHELAEKMDMAKSEALASFQHGGLYMEKYLTQPRHVEFQVLGDAYGDVLCLGDRDCSVQRNHQKIWEEAPCSVLSPLERETMIIKVISAMKKLGYSGAGTLEFLYEEGQFYFIEMNTRIQVEHPVTEMITGLDLVKLQIMMAAGIPLPLRQEDIVFRGHAIECRINAEHPETFCPSPGRVEAYLAPGGPFVRVDSALFPGCSIPPFYDSLVAKLIVYGETRDECLQRLRRALHEYVITGVDTLLPLHLRLCETQAVQEGNLHVKWLEQCFLAHHAPLI